MINRGYMLLDGSNLGMAATANTKLTCGDMEVQGIFHLVRRIQQLVDRFSMLKPVVLWDGASWRHKVFAEYKAGRVAAAGKVPTKQEEVIADLRTSFVAQRPYMQQFLTAMGVPQMHALNLEADDLAAILIRKKALPTNKIVLISADKDWLQLVRENVVWIDPINKRVSRKTNQHLPVTNLGNFEEGWGVPSPRHFLEMKALMGDPSDNIPGVGGIAAKGAIALFQAFGSVEGFLNMWIDKTIKNPDKLPKKFRDLAESDEKQKIYWRNMMLMDLNSPRIPTPVGTSIVANGHDHATFVSLCKTFMFKSILDQGDKFTAPLTRLAA